MFKVCHTITFIESGKIVRTKLSVAEEEKERVLKLDIDEIKRKSIVVEEILPATRPTGLFHSFEKGQIAYATMSASGPTKVWLVPSAKFREVVAKPEFSILFMQSMAKKIRDLSKKVQGFAHNSDNNDDDATIRCLSYDATSWVVENFDNVLKEFNQDSNNINIIMEYTTERLSTKSAVYAAGEFFCFLF